MTVFHFNYKIILNIYHVSFLLGLSIDMQFDSMVHQQIVGIPMGTNCALLIADLFLYSLLLWEGFYV